MHCKTSGRDPAFRSFALVAMIALALPGGAASAGAPAGPGAAEGSLEIQVEDHPDFSRTRHFLKSTAGRIELRFVTGKPPALPGGTRLRVTGTRTDGVMALASSDAASLSVTAAAVPANTIGEQKVAVLLVNFSDDASQPFTAAQAGDVVFNQTSAFMRENSFQATWFTGNTFGWMTLPIAKTCATSDISAAARQAAAAAGIDLAAYGRIVYMFPPNMGCGWSGVGTVGGAVSDAWINGAPTLKVVAHELGHNLGLGHSHASDCDVTALGPNCTTYEYGDVADVMGNVTASHFNAFQKERLGWLNAGLQPSIATVTASGTFAIGGYESAGIEPKALKILKSTDPVTGVRTWYYVEYRRPIGFDSGLGTLYASNLVVGVLVRTATDGDRASSYLLDMTPNTVATFDLGDAALVPGQSFSDSSAGVVIAVTGSGATQATVSVTLGATAGCLRGNPSLTVTGGGTVAAGAALSYAVSVGNTDSAGCGASVFNLQATPPAGWSASFANPGLALMPGATAATALNVASAAGAGSGAYAVGVKATNGSYPAATATAGATYSVAAPAIGALTTSVATDKAMYARNDSVALSAGVRAGGVAIANASVVFTLVKASGATVVLSATTNTSGLATASYRLTRKDPVGAWQVRESASHQGSVVNAAGSFTVR